MTLKRTRWFGENRSVRPFLCSSLWVRVCCYAVADGMRVKNLIAERTSS